MSPDDYKLTAKEIIRNTVITILGTAIAVFITISVLIACKKLPSVEFPSSSDKDIDYVLVLNGNQNIRIGTIEFEGELYRPKMQDTGSYVYITYYRSNNIPITKESIQKKSLKTAPENIIVFYAE